MEYIEYWWEKYNRPFAYGFFTAGVISSVSWWVILDRGLINQAEIARWYNLLSFPSLFSLLSPLCGVERMIPCIATLSSKKEKNDILLRAMFVLFAFFPRICVLVAHIPLFVSLPSIPFDALVACGVLPSFFFVLLSPKKQNTETARTFVQKKHRMSPYKHKAIDLVTSSSFTELWLTTINTTLIPCLIAGFIYMKVGGEIWEWKELKKSPAPKRS